MCHVSENAPGWRLPQASESRSRLTAFFFSSWAYRAYRQVSTVSTLDGFEMGKQLTTYSTSAGPQRRVPRCINFASLYFESTAAMFSIGKTIISGQIIIVCSYLYMWYPQSVFSPKDIYIYICNHDILHRTYHSINYISSSLYQSSPATNTAKHTCDLEWECRLLQCCMVETFEDAPVATCLGIFFSAGKPWSELFQYTKAIWNWTYLQVSRK